MGPAAAMTELGLDLRPPVSMSKFLGGAMWANAGVDAGSGSSSGLAKMEEYVRSLEDERRKIDAFKRELPLCMIILTDVIEALKKELMQCKRDGASPTSARPVLEQFMPISNNSKSTMVASAVDQEEEDEASGGDGSVAVKPIKAVAADEKMNWMMSAQLWSDNSSDCNTDTYSNSNTNNITSCYKATSNNMDNSKDGNYSVGSKRNQDERGSGDADRQSESGNPFASSGGYKYKAAGGGAFLPFNKALSSPQSAAAGAKGDENALVAAPPSLPVDLSLVPPGLNSKTGSSRAATAARLPEEYRSSSASSKARTFISPPSNNNNSNHLSSIAQQQNQGPRKARRCWSPELHRRFVSALQQLGGSQVATPKQIRELMKVDGLTNDEVKSHLQKYRLHTRRLTPHSGSAANQPPMVMLGGLWVSSGSPNTDECMTASKQSNNSLSGSPQGPLQLNGASRGLSFTGVDSCEEEDDRSESYSWKGSNNQRFCGEEETD